MKKTVAVILTILMLFTAALPCFAASPAKFSVNIVSESDTEAVISIDYDGGSSFQNFDFDLKFNDKKLKPKDAYEGDGLNSFVIASKKSGGNAISLINKDINPIKGTLASILPFKTVNGKDLFVVGFQKLTKDKLTANDVSLKFTTCQFDGANVQTAVTVFQSDTAPTPQSSTDKAQPTEKPDSSTSPPDGSMVSSENTELNASTAPTDSAETDAQQNSEAEVLTEAAAQTQQNAEKKDIKKMVWIPAVAICIVFVAVAIAVFAKKKKEDNPNENEK